MRTIRCSECFRPYTDNIDSKLDESKGGYIICSRCIMKLSNQSDKAPKKDSKRRIHLNTSLIDEKVKSRLGATSKA